MPLIDANRAFAPATFGPFDVHVVGAGVVGISLALWLTRRGRRVALFESGHLRPDESRQTLNEIEEIGKSFGNATWTRKRIVGGTGTAWGGQSLPFGELDFVRRLWVEDSGWPIPYGAVSGYYDAANDILGVETLSYHADALAKARLRNPFEGTDLDYHVSKWSPHPNLFEHYREEIERTTHLFYNCHVTDIKIAENGAVDALIIRNFSEEKCALRAAASVILATGGIESVRMLLAARHQRPSGLGNRGEVLGRYFMEHPAVTIGSSLAAAGLPVQRLLNTHLVPRRQRYSKRLSATRAWQERNALLNISATFLFNAPDGGISPVTALRNSLRAPTVRAIGPVLRGGASIARTTMSVLRDGLVFKPGCSLSVSVMCEQPPRRDNAISLSDKLDRFGVPLARLNWRIDASVPNTIRAFARTMKRSFDELGLIEVELDQKVISGDLEALTQALGHVNHHMGGARMSDFASSGVVDTNLRVWDVANLFVCSTSVFPTGSHSNPTLTALALGARLVDHLCSGSRLACPTGT